MMDRNAFLDRVRQAVAEGNRAGGAPPLPARGNLGYQGAGADPLQKFCAALLAAGGRAHLADSVEHAATLVLELVDSVSVRKILLGRGAALDELRLDEHLRQRQLDVVNAEAERDDWRVRYFAADLGISGVRNLIAETGTMVVASRTDDPRSVSLLPPVHIAVAWESQLLPDLFDLFAELGTAQLPSNLTLITGPSKTGDIELKLVTGVHGPGEIHVVVIKHK
jgi:L-lactate dehydrogenase complex protein LldG